MLELTSGWAQSQGQRAYQQDAITKQVWENGFALNILSDGMGGAVAGDIASKEILAAFNQSFTDSDEQDLATRMQDSLYVSNNQLADFIAEQPEYSGMGGTVVATAFTGKELYWVSVGDSPLWVVRNNELIRLNEDHSQKAELRKLIAVGEMTEEELAVHPMRNQLTSVVMGVEIAHIDNNVAELEAGDIVLLASDGVETISEQELLSICLRFKDADAEALAKYIINCVDNVNYEYQDNSTIMVMKVSG